MAQDQTFMPEEAPEFLLYTTEGCHLCDVAVQVIASVIDLNEVFVELVDIAEGQDAETMIRTYGERIPVFQHVLTGKEIGWPFEQTQLLAWLELLS
ncbi:glutaredoxin family protein [Litoribacillus peritrichatus]|uniref:Glutaredoxin family protein n=1 Tax=Litoribacillus peritrichatus TaxID=718191 RepID=A0ABP7MH74_9GAMM